MVKEKRTFVLHNVMDDSDSMLADISAKRPKIIQYMMTSSKSDRNSIELSTATKSIKVRL